MKFDRGFIVDAHLSGEALEIYGFLRRLGRGHDLSLATGEGNRYLSLGTPRDRGRREHE